ncbi:MAG: helix-turn-helix transcriptional regulator [Proteobacteria bacterium]|nr:helix-turn-helix transcriptional regulator [Pseudomonadota bacterium]
MDYDLLVDAIYRAGADPNEWSCVLRLLTGAFHGVCAAMHLGDAASDFSFGITYELDPESSEAYAKHFFAINPLNSPLTRIPAGKAIGDNELVPREIYRKGEFYNDYALRYGLNGSVTGILDSRNGHVSCVGVVTATGTDPHTAEEVSAFQRLMPHLRRAVELNRKFRATKANAEASHGALDQLNFGVVLLGENGVVLRANAIAAALANSANGIRVVQGRLKIANTGAQNRLDYLVGCAVNGVGPRGGPLLIPRAKGKPIFARILPYTGVSYDGVPAVHAIIYLRDPEASPAPAVDHIAMAYGLTSAESRVLRALLNDSDVRAIAENFGVSVATVRNQIARIMEKTGTTKQTQLMRLLFSAHLPLAEP